MFVYARRPGDRDLTQQAQPAAGPRLVLEVQNVTRRFESNRQAVTALENVSFQVHEGEFVCIVGASGGGKSTLLNIIAGLDAPDAGHTFFDGRHVTGPGPDRILVFQEPALLPWLNVRQNVEFGLKLKRMAARESAERVQRYLDLVHLGAYQELHPHELSGGMRQRVQIARALAVEPRMLLMDEPFAALDAQTREELEDELQQVWARTRSTVLFVTHNVREAALLADRVIVMTSSPGRVKTEIPVPLPRPRQPDSPHVNAVAVWIRSELQHRDNATQGGADAAHE